MVREAQFIDQPFSPTPFSPMAADTLGSVAETPILRWARDIAGCCNRAGPRVSSSHPVHVAAKPSWRRWGSRRCPAAAPLAGRQCYSGCIRNHFHIHANKLVRSCSVRTMGCLGKGRKQGHDAKFKVEIICRCALTDLLICFTPIFARRQPFNAATQWEPRMADGSSTAEASTGTEAEDAPSTNAGSALASARRQRSAHGRSALGVSRQPSAMQLATAATAATAGSKASLPEFLSRTLPRCVTSAIFY